MGAVNRNAPLSFALLLLLACSASAPTDAQRVPDDGSAYFPAAEWRRATPGALGLEPARVTQLLHDVAGGRYGVIDALIVVRFGYVGVELYNQWPATRAHTLQSVTKSITSLLYGITAARETQALRLDRPVVDVFPRYQGLQNLDGPKQALTLGHLLTMRTDMAFWEQPYPGSPLDQLNRSSDDWVRFILERPMTGAPGSDWAYNSGAAILTCGVLREVTGMRPDSLARRDLFEPIGVSGETWFTSPYDGLPHCGGGLSLKPLDLARIGYLVLRRGHWGTRAVVPEDWLAASFAVVTRPVPGFFAGFNPGYGRFWWLFPETRAGADAGVIAASGSGGQWLFVVPRFDLVIAIAAQSGAGLDVLYQVLAAVQP